MSDRYHVAGIGRPAIFDGRFYVARRDSKAVVANQPRRGFPNEREAESFLAGYLGMDFGRAANYEIVDASRIDGPHVSEPLRGEPFHDDDNPTLHDVVHKEAMHDYDPEPE